MAMRDARSGRLPETMTAEMPAESALALSLLSHEPDGRPGCWDLLRILSVMWGTTQPNNGGATAAGESQTLETKGTHPTGGSVNITAAATAAAAVASPSLPPRCLMAPVDEASGAWDAPLTASGSLGTRDEGSAPESSQLNGYAGQGPRWDVAPGVAPSVAPSVAYKHLPIIEFPSSSVSSVSISAGSGASGGSRESAAMGLTPAHTASPSKLSTSPKDTICSTAVIPRIPPSVDPTAGCHPPSQLPPCCAPLMPGGADDEDGNISSSALLVLTGTLAELETRSAPAGSTSLSGRVLTHESSRLPEVGAAIKTNQQRQQQPSPLSIYQGSLYTAEQLLVLLAERDEMIASLKRQLEVLVGGGRLGMIS